MPVTLPTTVFTRTYWLAGLSRTFSELDWFTTGAVSARSDVGATDVCAHDICIHDAVAVSSVRSAIAAVLVITGS